MQSDDFVSQRVRTYYWQDDLNCATTMLRILSEHFGVPLSEQVLDSAVGMHGAGMYGAQCGLVEGALLFLGIIGRRRTMPDALIVAKCREFAERFEQRFSSLQCRVLRPVGFHPANPPHLCEPLTCAGVVFALEFIEAAGSHNG